MVGLPLEIQTVLFAFAPLFSMPVSSFFNASLAKRMHAKRWCHPQHW